LDHRRLSYIFGAAVFLISASLYIYTKQPVLSFWDSGELSAAAFTLSVPHPPGAPFWIIIARFVTMLPVGSNPADKLSLFSAMFSSMSVTLLYLVIVKVIRNWKSDFNGTWQAATVYFSACIGAFSFAFCDSFWSISGQSGIYAFSAFLTILCIWLLMVWWEKADEIHSERYLILVAFIGGLALGINSPVLLLLMAAGIMYYFKNYEISQSGFWIAFVLISVGFLIVYPVITVWYPLWIGGSFAITIFALLLILLVFVAVIFSSVTKKNGLALALTVVLMIFAGYSVYFSVLVRAKVENLPINENVPKDLHALSSYINSAQAIDTPIWPRRYSKDAAYSKTWTNYSGETDFMWTYQINHMFNRYLGWQFIGRAGYMSDDGVDWKKLYGIPFFLGLFGLFYHFRKNWKLGFVFLWIFIIMGVLFALLMKQQDPQPRERDYLYQGAYIVFALWMGIGVMGVLELIGAAVKNSPSAKSLGIVFMLFIIVFVPGNMIRNNFHFNNRHRNYLPYDYARNTLRGLDKNAVLFTLGDNDTYPLWNLQLTQGYRTDVRVINLDLLNNSWYIKQIKNSTSNDSLKIPVSYTDEQINELTPIKWHDYEIVTMDIPPGEITDSIKDEIGSVDRLTWKMPSTISTGNEKAVRIQDIMVYDIIKSGKWQRPVYFSANAGDDNCIGLNEFLVSEGLAKRLVAYKSTEPVQYRVNQDKMEENLEHPESDSDSGYVFRGLNDPNIFYGEVETNIVQNYRSLYQTLAYSFYENGDTAKVLSILSGMEKNMPHNIVRMDYRAEHEVAMLYFKIGEKGKFDEYSPEVETAALNQMMKEPEDISSFYNPYRILLEIYEARRDKQKSLAILRRIDEITPNNPDIQAKIKAIENR